jgi:hypothetical protein
VKLPIPSPVGRTPSPSPSPTPVTPKISRLAASLTRTRLRATVRVNLPGVVTAKLKRCRTARHCTTVARIDAATRAGTLKLSQRVKLKPGTYTLTLRLRTSDGRAVSAPAGPSLTVR